MKQIKPVYSLLFLLSLFGLFVAMDTLLADKQVLLAGEISIKIPSLQGVLVEQKKADITNILAMQDSIAEPSLQQIDSTIAGILADSSEYHRHGVVRDSSLKVMQEIEYPGENYSALCHFFHALSHEIHSSRSLRVLHYGDSQIEGDRITGFLRKRLQATFGGSGPGFLSVQPLAPSPDFVQSWSSNWERYTNFTHPDKRVKHNQFGAAAGFSRFTPYHASSDTLPLTEAWCKLNYKPKSKKNNFSLKLFYGNAATPTSVLLKNQSGVIASDSLHKRGNFHIRHFDLPKDFSEITLQFKGQNSPDIYGLSLEGKGGILVDNFGLRGSSGTFFNRINRGQLASFYDHFRVRLIILQFGGNTLPYTKNKEQAVQFGKYLKAQIHTLKKLAPQASILVLGPTDMSVKEGTIYVTHPHLESLRDAIRDAAFQTNCAFFDVYEGMGGKNSMVSWVDAGIASKDYIHLMPNGARKIATMLYAALIRDYNIYAGNQDVCTK